MAGASWVNTYPGIPPDSVFGFTGGQGTPIVIDATKNEAYYASSKGIVPIGPVAKNYQIPIGGYYFSLSPVDPGLIFGYGTWVLISTGDLGLS